MLTVRLEPASSPLHGSFGFSLCPVAFDHSSPEGIFDPQQSGIFSSNKHHSYNTNKLQYFRRTFHECSAQPLSALGYGTASEELRVSFPRTSVYRRAAEGATPQEGRGGWAGAADRSQLLGPHPPLTGERGGAGGREGAQALPPSPRGAALSSLWRRAPLRPAAALGAPAARSVPGQRARASRHGGQRGPARRGLWARRGSPSAARAPGPADSLPLGTRRHFDSNL